MKESDVVARVVSVPDGKEHEYPKLRVCPVVQELQPLVDVVGHPGIGVDVEGLDQLGERNKDKTQISLDKWLLSLKSSY